MTLNLVADKIIKGKSYPALTQHQASPYTQAWREFGQHYPYTIPVRFEEYCETHGVPLNLFTIDDYPANSYYHIGLAFFNFEIDYFGMLLAKVLADVARGNLKVLFYYHEGDNPHNIKERLDALATAHNLDTNCYVFVSGNTAANNIPGFVYFCDFELWYWQRNKDTPALSMHTEPREREFTVLNRLHKSWRATAMADLHRKGLLDNSYWSYCETGSIVDADNPIEIDAFDNLRADAQQFLNGAPYTSDELSMAQRNDHSIVEAKYFVNAYCNIVMETHFDADNSKGAFITEKIFKPIKHGQLFYVAGCAGSLALLQDLGYKTFEQVFDIGYDRISNNTLRWQRLVDSLQYGRRRLDERFSAMAENIAHNQQLFAASKAERLNTLFRNIHEQN